MADCEDIAQLKADRVELSSRRKAADCGEEERVAIIRAVAALDERLALHERLALQGKYSV